MAFADFMTAMFALFLVLWLVSQADTKLKAAIANYFRSPGVFNTVQGGVLQGPKKVSKEPTSMTSKDDEQALFSTAALLQKKFSTRPEFTKYKEQIKIDVSDEGLRIELVDKAEKVSFDSGSAELNPQTRAILAEIAQGICALPNKIKVAGHTDRKDFPPGSTYTNWELSADRANAARRELEANCVRPEQIHRIVGYADTEPLVPEDPYAPANRRISIIVMRLVPNPASTPEQASENGAKPPTVVEPAVPAEKAGGKPADDKAFLKNKLESEGSVTVGEPDKIPRKNLPVRDFGNEIGPSVSLPRKGTPKDNGAPRAQRAGH